MNICTFKILLFYSLERRMLLELEEFNSNAKDNLGRNEECQNDLIYSIKKMIKEQPFLVNELNNVKPRLKKLIKKRIEELVKFIFPINEIQSTKR